MALYILKTEGQEEVISYAVTIQDCEKLVRTLYNPEKQTITNIVVKQKIGKIEVEWENKKKKGSDDDYGSYTHSLIELKHI